MSCKSWPNFNWFDSIEINRDQLIIVDINRESNSGVEMCGVLCEHCACRRWSGERQSGAPDRTQLKSHVRSREDEAARSASTWTGHLTGHWQVTDRSYQVIFLCTRTSHKIMKISSQKFWSFRISKCLMFFDFHSIKSAMKMSSLSFPGAVWKCWAATSWNLNVRCRNRCVCCTVGRMTEKKHINHTGDLWLQNWWCGVSDASADASADAQQMPRRCPE